MLQRSTSLSRGGPSFYPAVLIPQRSLEPPPQLAPLLSSAPAHHVHQFAGAAYAVSKAGLSTLTRELAHELGETGIRVNAVAPGEIATSILSPGTDELVQTDVPMKRLGRPMEVAEVVYFLSSEHASYVTGSEIHINGGQHI